MDWLNKRVFVTGATGLVGTALTAHLLTLGANVTVLVRDLLPDKPCTGCTIVRGDIREPGLVARILNEYSSEIVFHLAAQTQVTLANRSPLETLDVNIRGTYTLLDAVSRSKWVERCIVASSDKAYGACETLPYTEDTPLHGLYAYDASKACADRIAQSYAVNYPIAITRCANIYGGGDLNWQRLIPGTIRSALAGGDIIIRSDGRMKRDYLYIQDAVYAYIALAESTEVNAFNFSSEAGAVDVLTIANMINRLCGERSEIKVLNMASNEIQEQYLCSERAHKRLNWYAAYTLQAGLIETVDWYRGYVHASSR